MKKLILLAIFTIITINAFGQLKDSLIEFKKEIELKKEKLQIEINNLDKELEKISNKINQIEFSNNPHFKTTVSYSGYLRDTPNPFGKSILNIDTNDTIEIIDKIGDYWKAKFQNKFGYISDVYIEKTPELIKFTEFLESQENKTIETDSRFKLKPSLTMKSPKKHPSRYSVNTNLNLSGNENIECLSCVNSMIKIKDKEGNTGYIDSFNFGVRYEVLRSICEGLVKKDLQYIKEAGKNIFINGAYVTNINSASGVNFKIELIYIDKSKTIKYIYFTVLPYNAVGDIVTCNIDEHSTFTGKVTGPIDAEENIKYYEWENAWYNNTVQCIKITKVKIIYLDGSSYTYVNELPKILNHKYINKCN